jgi:pimeloyl-[acyl-carrier protein] methyl ester esterase
MNPITLVLLPGLDGTGRLFNPLMEVLPSYLIPLVIPYPANRFLGYRELLIYVRGQIPTDKPFVLLAESFSGPVAVEFAATHPSNLEALILCASFVTNPAPAFFRPFSILFNARFFKLRPPQFMVRHFLLGKRASSDLVNTFLEALESVSPEVLAYRLRSVLNVDSRDALRECRVPILYLAAKRDKLVGEGNLAEIKSFASNVEAQTIDTPHFLLQSEPEEAMKTIDSFLRRSIGGNSFNQTHK